MGFFLDQPNFVQLIQYLFDAILIHFLIFKLHFEHYLVACSWGPDHALIDFYFAAAASPLSLELLVETVTLHPFRDVLEVVYFFEVVSEITELFVFFRILEEQYQSFDCLLGLVEFEKLRPFGFFAHVDFIHVVLHLADLLLEELVDVIQIFDFALIVLLIEL